MHCVVRCEFDAGHRLLGHTGRCCNLHGHRYVVETHIGMPGEEDASTAVLDALGMLVDFGILKSRINGWLDSNWDHAFMVNSKDVALLALLGSVGEHTRTFVFDGNPTAEAMASLLLNEVVPKCLDGTGAAVVKVVVWETPNCRVEASA